MVDEREILKAYWKAKACELSRGIDIPLNPVCDVCNKSLDHFPEDSYYFVIGNRLKCGECTEESLSRWDKEGRPRDYFGRGELENALRWFESNQTKDTVPFPNAKMNEEDPKLSPRYLSYPKIKANEERYYLIAGIVFLFLGLLMLVAILVDAREGLEQKYVRFFIFLLLFMFVVGVCYIKNRRKWAEESLKKIEALLAYAEQVLGKDSFFLERVPLINAEKTIRSLIVSKAIDALNRGGLSTTQKIEAIKLIVKLDVTQQYGMELVNSNTTRKIYAIAKKDPLIAELIEKTPEMKGYWRWGWERVIFCCVLGAVYLLTLAIWGNMAGKNFGAHPVSYIQASVLVILLIYLGGNFFFNWFSFHIMNPFIEFIENKNYYGWFSWRRLVVSFSGILYLVLIIIVFFLIGLGRFIISKISE